MQCRQEWKDATEGITKLDTYREDKDFAEIATLAKANLPRNERSSVAHLLCGIHTLEIETGRFGDKRRQTRHCRVCNDSDVEGEVMSEFVMIVM